jgi:phosphoribosyl 1,2-cyclic phosphodiesterase
MKVRFWGTRGSIPTPLSAEDVQSKIHSTLEMLDGRSLPDAAAIQDYIAQLPFHVRSTIGGNTSCVEVLAGEHHIILDAGSGIRPLGRELMKGKSGQGQATLHLFLSHLHWDHIQGFPFFAPARVPGNRIFIYSAHQETRSRFAEQQRPEHFPVSLGEILSALEFIHLEERDTTDLGGVLVHNIPFSHPGTSYGYRIESEEGCIVYATDAEYQDLEEESTKQYVEFFRGADALIFDAQYSLEDALLHKETWGHSSSFIGLDIASRSNVKRLILFHHEPVHSDQEILEMLEATGEYHSFNYPDLNCEILVAYEGLTLEI